MATKKTLGGGTPLTKNSHLYLVDGSAYLFRAYHALPPLTRKSDGLPVGAVSGFCNMLQKLVLASKERGDRDAPTHFAVIFDAKGDTFRNEIYSDYKANRDAPPEDMVPQFPLVRDATRAFSLPSIEMTGFEADDLIATYAKQAATLGAEVTIVSSDKDLMQLVDDKIEMLDPMKDKVIDSDGVVEKFGVTPDKVVEVQALAGDSSDNVPGVPGIGIKTAALLINEFGDLENLLANAESIKQKKRRENLIEFAEQARISRRLVLLDQDVPVDVPLDDMAVVEPDAKKLIGFLKDMEFNTLTRRMAEMLDADADAIEAAGDHKSEAKPKAAPSVEAGEAGGTPGAMDPAYADNPPIEETEYDCVTTIEALDEWIAEAYATGLIGLDTETTSLDPMSGSLVGISLATKPGRACYIPLTHGMASEGTLALDDPAPEQIPVKDAIARLKPLLEDSGVMKVLQNAKYDLVILKRAGIDVYPIDDTMLISYALDTGLHSHGMDALSQRFLEHTPIPFKEVAGTGKAQITFDKVSLDKATRYAAEDADVTLRLYHVLKPRLVGERMMTVYETLERPMVGVLQQMEMAGIKLDPAILKRMSSDFAQKLAGLEAEIHELAGEEFNIGSPKQLGEILFDKMGIEGGKKTKTGAWGTGADVLETLAAQGHDLPIRVLEWRQLSKLKSTYTDALPDFINEETGRVHTSYSLASTTTGRLSSSDPNLQNIPIRTEEGRKIRTAFVADDGNVLISADYSQIELRVLAHMAGIDTLRQAFADGLDIHAMTASEMFNEPIEGMDPMIRRKAKAINFGIIYGISAFGLANQLSIPRGEAAEYIDKYFERFPGIRAYMDETKAYAREHGFVSTLFGRKTHLPEIASKNGAQRSFTERAAINAPIQGSAADIIRRAMIRMPEALEKAKLPAKMLLQVHDELIFEVPEKQADKTIKVVREVMEGAAAPAVNLSVPLVVDANAALSWAEAH
ncbi:DNA polymerase I [Candidatus Phaeomarinobacter ectocarpi]|uniref:DNA polymerase I n=1 Tax=Candidatus Phaeomarinibacter ectocarpi TaxID=1458461 RepID=X5M9B2_9HYPH|nr:DNA polymerase I [Candidatus Phaeomarinobacter ectocarpi]CDO60083.1 DNA polymerase I [Candidatus Phaeomarinobacter ectocarpi]